MLDAFEATKRWKQIKEYTNKIQDPVLKESFLSEYQQRAIDEWGYCPDKKEYKKTPVEFDDWQKLFLKKVKTCMEFGVFVKDEKEEQQAKANMRCFIEKGGHWEDLPKELQNKHTEKLYIETLMEEIKICKDFLLDLEKK